MQSKEERKKEAQEEIGRLKMTQLILEMVGKSNIERSEKLLEFEKLAKEKIELDIKSLEITAKMCDLDIDSEFDQNKKDHLKDFMKMH